MTDTQVRPRPPGATDRPPVADTKGALRKRRRKEYLTAYLFLLPWFVGLIAITAGPLLTSLYLSFTDYSLIGDSQWVGFDNYTRMFQDDPRFIKALTNTAIYVFVSVPLQLAFALALAMVLDRGVSGLPIYRSVYYLPSLLGSSVAIAILWRQIFGADGLVNEFLGIFGIEGMGWVSHPDTALGTLIILNVWTFGSPMVIFLAGLRQIPTSYYEAASLDGASKSRQFFSITLPLLSPIIFFNLILQLINAFQSFTQAFVISGGNGSPADSTLLYTMHVYQKGFNSFEMGYASAMAWVLVLIIAALTGVNFLMSKYWVFYSDK
ncbi:carbohydrate ABC transporter permease [Streptomyces xiamenensis]